MTLEIVSNLPKDENDLLAFGLDELAKLGARRILNQALQLEVEEYINQFKEERAPTGKRLVVRNGKSKQRNVTTGCGTFPVETPRVHDRREGKKFTSKILPPYLRRSQNVESILPVLYLKGLSGNVFTDALSDLLGDGGLGLWAAIREMELFKKTREQRCWVHKIANVLNLLPKRLHTQAKSLLHEMMKAPTKSEANRQLGIFRSAFNDKYEKAYKCIDKDWEVLTSFFDFPATQWTSLRTSNPIESVFASVKLRTAASRGAGSVTAAEVMAFKLMQECEKKWRPI